MALIFYILGWIVILIGGFWSGAVVYSASQTGHPSGVAVLAAMMVALPGLGTMFSGLLLLAVGGVLGRLDRIVQNTELPAPRREVDMIKWSRADRERWEQQQR